MKSLKSLSVFIQKNVSLEVCLFHKRKMQNTLEEIFPTSNMTLSEGTNKMNWPELSGKLLVSPGKNSTSRILSMEININGTFPLLSLILLFPREREVI
jgi:hypothetical protein